MEKENGLLPSDWGVQTTSQFCKRVSDGTHDSPKPTDVGMPLITSRHMIGGKIDLSNAYKISEGDFIKINQRSKVDKWDVLISMIGTVGEVCIVKDDPEYAIKNIGLFKCGEEYKAKWIYNYLRSPFGQRDIKGKLAGTTQGYITLNELRNLTVPLPPKGEIIEINSILSSLDDKIELNLQMNKTLEAIAQAIFKEWFVDFRFPGFDGELVDGLPKGWTRKSFKYLLSLLKDGSHNPPERVKEGIRFIAGATDIKDLVVQFDKCTYISKDDYKKIHKNWDLSANDLLITIVGTIGNTAIVRESDLPFSLQRSIAVIRPIPEISHLYIYLILKSKEFRNYLRSRTNPTGQPGVYLGTLSEYETIVPTKEVMHRFHEIQSALFEKMLRNITENQTLVGIRDSLLPKLMTGKIRVA